MTAGLYIGPLALLLVSLTAGVVSSQFTQPQHYFKLWSTLFSGLQNRTSFFDAAGYLDRVYNDADPIYEDRQNLFQRAVQLSSMDICLMLAKLGVNPKCCEHTRMVLSSIINKEIWALKMFDSFGKIPSGVMQGNFRFPGSYYECRSLSVAIPANFTGHLELYQPFSPKFCQVIFPVKQFEEKLAVYGIMGFTFGVCVPDSCSPTDISTMVNEGVHLLPFNATQNYSATAHCETEPIYDGKAIFSLVACSLFLALLISATLYDVISNQGQQQPKPTAAAGVGGVGEEQIARYVPINQTEEVSPEPSSPPDEHEQANTAKLVATKPCDETSLAGKILRCFSVYHNGAKLLKTDQSDGTLSSVHGVRFLSMSWVILGHVYVFSTMAIHNPFDMVEYLKGFAFQTIGNALVSVDSFFLLSGLLVSYSTLRTMRANGGKMNWLYFYVHRFWRLTPPYMLLMMVYIPLSRYWGHGPFWPMQGFEMNFCKDSWYYNLFYINNFLQSQKMCMAWTWYLANDMQFYWISPLLIVPLYKSAKIGHLITVLMIVAHLVTTGVIATDIHSSPIFIQNPNQRSFDDIYIKPYTRIGPYLIGILYGYQLYRNKHKTLLNGYISSVLWSLATISAVSVLYGLYNIENGVVIAEPLSIFYITIHRTVWGICVGWVVYACCTGYGGFVNKILSWKSLIPVSRLTYCAYLVHPLVLFCYYLNQPTTLTAMHMNFVFLFFGVMAITFMLSFVMSMAFEAPMLGLEKVLRERFMKK